jgi:PilZ domain
MRREENPVAGQDERERFESQDERRSYDRSRLIVDVFFDGKDVTGVASTKDISPGGLYMNTQAEIPEGALLLVRIPFRQDVQVVCNAMVVYSNPGHGVGLKFQGLSDEVKAVLEQEVSK